MPLQIINQDITTMAVDVIVNPTNGAFSGSGGTDCQIHTAAGKEMAAECLTFSPLSTGDVKETHGYNLPCRYVIHTVGPVWAGGVDNEQILLRSCYVNSLILALKLGAKSVAFPLISSGTFGFPKDKVMRLAMRAISDFLCVNDCELDVFICVVDKSDYELSNKGAFAHYLESALQSQSERNLRFSSIAAVNEKTGDAAKSSPDINDWLKKQDDNFAVTLLKLIDKMGMTDVQCYKKANVSRKTFSKINTDKNYRPSKQTVIAFAIALELTLDETEQLLKTVGFSLSHSNTFDMIIEFCIKQGIYDVFEINEILYQYDQVCLGC